MSKVKKTYKLEGMNCSACAKMIELDLEDAGINAKCSYAKQTLEVADTENNDKIKSVVEKSGYKLIE